MYILLILFDIFVFHGQVQNRFVCCAMEATTAPIQPKGLHAMQAVTALQIPHPRVCVQQGTSVSIRPRKHFVLSGDIALQILQRLCGACPDPIVQTLHELFVAVLEPTAHRGLLLSKHARLDITVLILLSAGNALQEIFAR